MFNLKPALPILIVVVGTLAWAQQKSNSYENELSGPEIYKTYCASCHGLDGKGSGPVSEALKKTVPDLTLISRRNKGQFPAFRVTHIIDGYEITAVHGTRDMPVWGDYFRDKKSRDEALLKLREHNLTEYIRSIQQK